MGDNLWTLSQLVRIHAIYQYKVFETRHEHTCVKFVCTILLAFDKKIYNFKRPNCCSFSDKECDGNERSTPLTCG